MIRPSSSTQRDVVFPSILINTAGYVSLSDMEMTPPEETMKHLTTNVLGPMLCSQAFARLYFAARLQNHPRTRPHPAGLSTLHPKLRMLHCRDMGHTALPRLRC
jgi:NAD(P)-dependent dehydrogenase (short-subunit alcohol dehydrogenase family)